MAGNSGRRGAVRKPGTKKGAIVGSGGQKSRGLQGKGPTPKATERKGHPAARAAAYVRAALDPPSSDRRRDGGRAAAGSSSAGRNPVVEALRAEHPRPHPLRRQPDRERRAGQGGAQARDRPRAGAARGQPHRPGPDDRRRHPPGAGAAGSGVRVRAPVRPAGRRACGHAPLVVALDGVTDPRNLGAVIRSVAAFGGDGVVVPERRAAGMTASAWKVSAGAAARVRVARATNLTRALRGVPAGRLLRRRPRRRGRRGDRRPRGGDGAAGARRRLGGARALPAGPADLRRRGVDPDGRRDGVPQRRCGSRDRALRGGPPAGGAQGRPPPRRSQKPGRTRSPARAASVRRPMPIDPAIRALERPRSAATRCHGSSTPCGRSDRGRPTVLELVAEDSTGRRRSRPRDADPDSRPNPGVTRTLACLSPLGVRPDGTGGASAAALVRAALAEAGRPRRSRRSSSRATRRTTRVRIRPGVRGTG